MTGIPEPLAVSEAVTPQIVPVPGLNRHALQVMLRHITRLPVMVHCMALLPVLVYCMPFLPVVAHHMTLLPFMLRCKPMTFYLSWYIK